MVDALRAAHRRIARGGLLIDARPDHTRPPRVIARGRVRGHLVQCPDADARDRRADAAVARVVADGLFRYRGERGVVWHSSALGGLAGLDAYLDDSTRYCGLSPGTCAALRPMRRGPIAMRRAIAFQVLDRI